MRRRIVECVANFSEGRDPRLVEAIAEAVLGEPGIALLHKTLDPDHNRSVLTFAGAPEAVLAAAVRSVGAAVERIDLTRHSGVHPRIGAADVVPFVPVENVTLEDCVALAHEAGRRIWETCRVPVYFYEAAALRADRVRLEQVRRGQFEVLRELAPADPARRPDIGGPALHPTAGAVAVGARKVLIAFNVNLATEDLEVARAIARKIRASSGGFPHVKALGLPLASRGLVQVSMNLTDYEQTPVHVVYEAIRREAAHLGVDIAGSEIIGLIPRAALERAAESALRIENLQPSTVLETRIAETLPWGLRDLLEEWESPVCTGGGSLAAAGAGAMAASLGARVCRLTGQPAGAFEQHRDFFLKAAPGDRHEASLLLAERASQLAAALEALAQRCPPRLLPDVRVGAALAAAARDGAVAAVQAQLAHLADPAERERLDARLRQVR